MKSIEDPADERNYLDTCDGVLLMPNGVVYDTGSHGPLVQDKYAFFRTDSGYPVNNYAYSQRSFFNVAYGNNGTSLSWQDAMLQVQAMQLQIGVIGMSMGASLMVGSLAAGTYWQPPGVMFRAGSVRQQYLGSTPSKWSRTGRLVQERMRAEGRLRGQGGAVKVKYTDPRSGQQAWTSIKNCDMAHRYDAVRWWNRYGFRFGPRSPAARKWMLDPDNYELQPYWVNRSQGAELRTTYKVPQ